MKKIMIAGAVVILLIVAVAVFLLSNINSIVKSGIETFGPRVLKAPVTLDSARISVFSGAGELQGFTVGNPQGFKTDHAFKMDRLKVELDVGSVTSDKIHIKNVLIDSPNIVFEGTLGKSNLSQLQTNAKAFVPADTGGQKESSSSKGKKIQIDYLKIQNASIRVSMAILQGKKLTIPLPTLNLKDIGKDKEAGVGDVIAEVLGAVNKAVIPAVQGGLANIGGILNGGAAGDLIKQGTGGDMDKLKGLFGK